MAGKRKTEPGREWNAATLAEVAEFFGVTTQTVRQWRIHGGPQGGMPGARGKYPLDEITRWRLALTEHTWRQDSERNNIAKERERLIVRKLQLEVAETESRLTPTIEVRRDVRRWLDALRSRLLHLPDTIAGIVPADVKVQARQLTERACWAAMKEAAQAVVCGSRADAPLPEETAEETELGTSNGTIGDGNRPLARKKQREK